MESEKLEAKLLVLEKRISNLEKVIDALIIDSFSSKKSNCNHGLKYMYWLDSGKSLCLNCHCIL